MLNGGKIFGKFNFFLNQMQFQIFSDKILTTARFEAYFIDSKI